MGSRDRAPDRSSGKDYDGLCSSDRRSRGHVVLLYCPKSRQNPSPIEVNHCDWRLMTLVVKILFLHLNRENAIKVRSRSHFDIDINRFYQAVNRGHFSSGE